MAKKNTFNWGKASMIAGAGVFLYLAFRKPAQSAAYKRTELPFNPSRDDPKHWAYQLRPGPPNPGYDMANYSRDVYIIGESLNWSKHAELVPEGYTFCELYGPFNNLQSPYGPRTGFVVEVFKTLTKEQYDEEYQHLETDLTGYNHFFERLFIPIWLPNPQDQKFTDALAAPSMAATVEKGVMPLVRRGIGVAPKVKTDPGVRNAYNSAAWIGRELTAGSEYQPCGFDDRQDDLLPSLPWSIEQMQKYHVNRDARDDL